MKLRHLLPSLLCTLATVHGELRAGAAQVKITPPQGTGMAGYYHFRAADGVLDDLHARALVIDDGTTRAAMITLDLIGTPRELVDAVRSEVEKSGTVPRSHVMISATHAHTGPELGDPLRLSTKTGAPPVAADSPQAAYFKGLPALIASSVTEAAKSLTPVAVTAISGDCPGLTYCRRFYLKDGTTAWNPGKLNPNVMLPTALPDDQVQAVFFTPQHPPGQHTPSLAVYANFSMHPDTVGGTSFSADYPGVLAKLMSAYHGPGCVTLFGNGACGNLNHLDVNWARSQGGIPESSRIGTLLAAAVFRAEKNQSLPADGPLGVQSITVPVELPPLSKEEEALARETVRRNSEGDRRSFMELVRANRILDLAARAGTPLPVEIQAISLGKEIAWVSFPGEMFTELGLALKKRSPFPRTMVVTLANGNWGYVPDRRSYAEGAYEVESARVPAGTGELLAEEAVKLLTGLHAGR